MFYSEYVLAKKGPLGKVWLAAHWNKKLTRAMIAKSDVIEACQSIIKPAAPLALRTSGHLLLGVVRIHDSKQKSLMNDCSEALIKIKLAFRPGLVDLPVSSMQASYNAITLQESFQEFDGEQPLMFDGVDEVSFGAATGRVHEITLKESKFSSVEDPNAAVDFGEAVPFFAVEQGRDEMPAEIGRDADITMERSLGLEQSADTSAAMRDISMMDRRDDDYQMDMPPQAAPDAGPMSPLEISVLATPTTKLAQAKRSKRKIAADSDTELKGAYIRQRLETSGPDDVTRTPYSEDAGPVTYDRAPSSCVSAIDENMEVAFLVPSTTGWARPFRDVITRTFFCEAALARPQRRKKSHAASPPPQQGMDEQQQPNWEHPVFEAEMPPFVPDDAPRPDQSFMDVSAFSSIGDTSLAAPAGDARAEVTAHEFEHAARSKRTQKMTENLRNAFAQQSELSFDAMTQGQTRRVAAACLFELLVLASDGALSVVQEEPYGDISVTATKLFPITA